MKNNVKIFARRKTSYIVTCQYQTYYTHINEFANIIGYHPEIKKDCKFINAYFVHKRIAIFYEIISYIYGI